jgi:hypothetical protein
LLLLFTFLIAYLIFNGKDFSPIRELLDSLGYFGTFLAGILFSYGFTAAPATAIMLLLAKEQNVFLAGIIGGLGALFTDLVLFRFIRTSFAEEIRNLSKEKIIKKVGSNVPKRIRKYIICILAGFIIASPLPDEIGVSLFAAATTLSTRVFAVLSYLLNTLGILTIFALGSLL